MEKLKLKHYIKTPHEDLEISFETKDQVLEFIKNTRENIDRLESAIYIFTEMILNYNPEYNSNLLESEACKDIYCFSEVMIEEIKRISSLSMEEREFIYEGFYNYEEQT